MKDASHDLHTDIEKEEEAKEGLIPKEEGPPERTDIVLYAVLGTIIAILLVLVFGWRLVFPTEPAYSLDELHELNLAGDLDPQRGYVYEGFSFVNFEDRWFTRFMRPNTTKVFDVELRFGPREAENVSLVGDPVPFIKENTQNATYVTFDPLQENLSFVALAAADVTTALNKIFFISAYPACTQNKTGTCHTLPTVTCTDGLPVILLRDALTPSVVVNGSCIIVEGKNMELVRAADRLLLEWYGAGPQGEGGFGE